MLRRTLLVAAGGTTAVTVGILAQNNWDVNSIGAVRFGRAAVTFGSIAYDYKHSVYSKTVPGDEDELDQLWSNVHLRSAKKLLQLCESNRGVFIKVGQHLGALEYMLPPEYCNTLKVLHNSAPESSLEDVYSVIKEDLKGDVDTLFSEFDPEPLGAASLAQVYKAKLKTGETVAVKVQHRDVRPNGFVDMKTMEILVKLANRMFPDFKLMWLAEAVKQNLPLELDFINEGENAERIGNDLQNLPFVHVPKIHWKMTTERVLVMEYLDGGFVTDLEYMKKNGISAKEVVDKVGEMFSDMIFIHGNVHADPHPGNILVRKDENGKLELCLLDHGLYARLSNQFKHDYALLWLSIMHSDVDGIKKYADNLGAGDLYGLFACIVTARSWESISNKQEGGIATIKTSQKEKQHIKENIGRYLPQITEVFERIPRSMILVLKTNDLLRGVESALKVQKTMVKSLPMPSADFVMDPWLEKQPGGDTTSDTTSDVLPNSSDAGFDNDFSERTDTESADPRPFEKLPDSDEYLSRLERKLKRIQSVTNGGEKKNVTSKEIITSLEQTRESYMLRLLNDTVTPSAPENGEGSHDHLNMNPILKRLAPEKQPIALEELVQLLKADQLAAVMEAEGQVDEVAEKLEDSEVSDK